MNERSLSISLCSFNNNNILSHNTIQTSIINNNNTLRKVGVGTLEFEDSKKEEDLVEEEAKLYVIIMGSQNTLPDIGKVL